MPAKINIDKVTRVIGATSIVTYVLQYNGGVMPETQVQLDTVLSQIPEDSKKSVLGDPMTGIIRFSTMKISMSQQNSLKELMITDIAFLEPPIGISVKPPGISR